MGEGYQSIGQRLEFPEPIGKVVVQKVLEFYDEPLLYTARSDAGQTWLVVLAADNKENQVWLFAALSLRRLRNVFLGIIDLRDAFLHAESGTVVELHREKAVGGRISTAVVSSNVDDSRLPLAGEVIAMAEHTAEAVQRPPLRMVRPEPAREWVYVEVMGHKRFAGLGWESGKFFQLLVPGCDRPLRWGCDAIFQISPATEAGVRLAVEQGETSPIVPMWASDPDEPRAGSSDSGKDVSRNRRERPVSSWEDDANEDDWSDERTPDEEGGTDAGTFMDGQAPAAEYLHDLAAKTTSEVDRVRDEGLRALAARLGVKRSDADLADHNGAIPLRVESVREVTAEGPDPSPDQALVLLDEIVTPTEPELPDPFDG